MTYFAWESRLAIYTFLTGDPDRGTGLPSVEYQVRAHFEWNGHRPELKKDQIDGKHFQIAKRSLTLGGRQDIFLGTRDCQGYVEPCEFGTATSDYDGKGELGFGLMFHSFDYPDETGGNKLGSNFWRPQMVDGVILFPRPEDCPVKNLVRETLPKRFGVEHNLLGAVAEAEGLGDPI